MRRVCWSRPWRGGSTSTTCRTERNRAFREKRCWMRVCQRGDGIERQATVVIKCAHGEG